MNSVEELKTIKKAQKKTSPWAIARRKFLNNKLAIISSVFLIFIMLMSFLAPYITTIDISRVNVGQSGLEPSLDHWLGTDNSGRDVYTRLLYGGRVSLTVGISVTMIVITFGTFIGSMAGYFGGKIDSILMRFTDFVLNFPFLVFVIVIGAIFFGRVSGVTILIVVISALSWGGIARIVRSKILVEKENEYILAAKSIGTTSSKIIMKHLLPNILSIIIVQATLTFAGMIVAEAGLSFLGFGVPAEVPSWGNMLSSANQSDVLQNKPWIWMPPALAITLTILSINFIGEGLKDAFNPTSNKN